MTDIIKNDDRSEGYKRLVELGHIIPGQHVAHTEVVVDSNPDTHPEAEISKGDISDPEMDQIQQDRNVELIRVLLSKTIVPLIYDDPAMGVMRKLYCTRVNVGPIKRGTVLEVREMLTDTRFDIDLTRVQSYTHGEGTDTVNKNPRTWTAGYIKMHTIKMEDEVQSIIAKYEDKRLALKDMFLREPEDMIKCELKAFDGRSVDVSKEVAVNMLTEILCCQHLFQPGEWQTWLSHTIDAKNRWLEIIHIFRDHAIDILIGEQDIAKADNDQETVGEINIIKQMLMDIETEFIPGSVVDVSWPPILLPVPRILRAQV